MAKKQNKPAPSRPAKPAAKSSPKQAPKQVKPAPVAAEALPVGFYTAGALAVALGFLLYANTFGHQFTLDDFSAIKDNWVTKGGLKNIGIIFSTEYRYGAWSSPGSLYRPIPLAMFAAEWRGPDGAPMIGHVMNVLFYALSGWALWFTWRRVLFNYPPVLAALATLFFMAHPVHTEVVANIKSRDEILSLLFCTWALYAIWRHLETGRTKWMVWAMVSYAAAMFSKEGSITYLAVFPLTVWFFGNRSIGESLRIMGLMAVPAAFFLLVRHQVLAAQPYNEVYSILDNFIVGAKNSADRLASAFMMCWEYLRVLLFPITLVSDRGYPQFKPVNFSDWRALLGFFLYAGMFLWAVIFIWRKQFLAFVVLYYFITFSLYSNVLVTIGTSYGERLLYMPSLALALALAFAIVKLFRITDREQIWNPNGKQALVWGIAGAVLALYSLRTLIRNTAWFDSASLYAADIVSSPDCAKLNYHYALEKVRTGMNEKESSIRDTSWVLKGIEGYTNSIRLYPEYHDAYGSRGLAYFRLGQYDKAFSDYQVAVKHRPNDAKVLSNMGYIYFLRAQRPGNMLETGLLDSAENVYRRSVKYDPRFVDARRNLGAVLAMKKNFPAAIEQWQEGLKYDENNATLLYYIGSAYRDMGQPEKAQPWFERARAINPALK